MTQPEPLFTGHLEINRTAVVPSEFTLVVDQRLVELHFFMDKPGSIYARLGMSIGKDRPLLPLLDGYVYTITFPRGSTAGTRVDLTVTDDDMPSAATKLRLGKRQFHLSRQLTVEEEQRRERETKLLMELVGSQISPLGQKAIARYGAEQGVNSITELQIPPLARYLNYDDMHALLNLHHDRLDGARCMRYVHAEVVERLCAIWRNSSIEPEFLAKLYELLMNKKVLEVLIEDTKRLPIHEAFKLVRLRYLGELLEMAHAKGEPR